MSVRPLQFALIALLLSAALGAAHGQGKSKGAAPRARPVVVAQVRQVSELPTFKANGLLSPVEKALLSVDVPGRVEAIHVRQGIRVKQGQVLAELTNTELRLNRGVLRAQVREAEAQLALSRQKLLRAQALFKQKLASAEQYENEAAATDVTIAKLESTRAQLKALQAKLEMMVVRAPISGQVIRSELEIGQWISSNKPIYEIYNYDRFEVLVGVPGRFITRINREGPVSVQVTEIGKDLQGKIAAIVRHVEAASGNFLIRVRVDNPKGIPLSGLLAQIDVPLGNQASVLTVPRDAIVRRAGKTHVVAVKEGKAQIVPVRVEGNFDQDEVIVTGNALRAGDTVVVRGNERLFKGAPVRVTGNL
jgi:RND family efflux transporter MFP subunit